jgi:protein SCO1
MTTRSLFGLKRPDLLRRSCVVAALLSITTLMTACSPAKPTFHAMDVSGAPWGKTFSLPNLDGQPTSPQDFPGKITVVFFGFMYCPDACPTHLTKMERVKTLLGKDGEKIQAVFITVDPERDQPESLRKFLNSFDPAIVGLRGSVEATQDVAKEFRVFFKKVPTSSSAKDPMAYTIDHTTFSYVFDGKGQLRLVIPHDLAEDKIAEDFKNLISQ